MKCYTNIYYHQRPFEYETTEDLQAAIRRGYVNYPTKDRQVSGECLAVIQGVSTDMGYINRGYLSILVSGSQSKQTIRIW